MAHREIATAPSGPRNDSIRTLKLVLAYDGAEFSGWQRQKNGRSVQAVLEGALQQLTGKPVAVTGASRTDSGVHAGGQVAHAKIATRLSPVEIRKALNAILPEDVLICSVAIAPARFHARYSAQSKLYRYQIWNDPLRPLFGREQMHHVRDRLGLPAMRRAARQLKGRHDFRAFCSEPAKASGAASSSRSHTVRTVKRISLKKEGPLITLEVRGDGFLYHMVRRMAGFLIEIGKGKPAPPIPPTAPAKGLCLISVRY